MGRKKQQKPMVFKTTGSHGGGINPRRESTQGLMTGPSATALLGLTEYQPSFSTTAEMWPLREKAMSRA